ncbi:uncharacterized protein LOC119681643, partial [Teleopsis dalmanni]|uniref:uncharacterized protein LOC119681643 n=2 Tax=Teleopsis dalmanni TaxID=139649 RepID=UPI0018CF29E8
FGFSTLILFIYLNEEKEYLFGEQDQPAGESILEKGDITATTVIFNVLFFGCSFLLAFSSILVLVGLKNDKRELLIPWISFMLCDVLIEIAHLIYLSFKEKVIFDPIVGFLFTIDFFIMCLNCYCLLCVISQYQDYKQGRGCGRTQMRAEVMLQVMRNEPNGTSLSPPAYQQKNLATSPFVTSNQHTNISTIPEEAEESLKHTLTKECTNSMDRETLAINVSPENCAQHRFKIPTITVDSNSKL